MIQRIMIQSNWKKVVDFAMVQSHLYYWNEREYSVI